MFALILFLLISGIILFYPRSPISLNSPMERDFEIHKKMTIENTDQWGYGDFNIFKREFLKREWINEEKYRDSFFDRSTNSKIHAKIYQFDGIGMVIKEYKDYCEIQDFLEKRKIPKKIKVENYKWE